MCVPDDARGNEDVFILKIKNFGAEIMKTKLVATVILAGMMLFAACSNSHKTDADAAIKSAQTAYATVADQANQYVPDQSKQVQAAIQSAKDSFRQGRL
jgi:outer membrane murein-binding lipoprotein Lpp